MPEFVEYARKANPPLFYASGGNGSQHQLGIEMFKQRAGINLVHVPYRGGGPAGTATVAGETAVVLAGASSAGLLKGGQLRGLATTGRKRSPLFPEMPMVADFYPGYDVTIWLGLFAPAGTPEPIVTQLRDKVQKALADPELMKKLNVTGALEPLVLPPAEFNELIRRDHEKYGKVARDVGVKTRIALAIADRGRDQLALGRRWVRRESRTRRLDARLEIAAEEREVVARRA